MLGPRRGLFPRPVPHRPDAMRGGGLTHAPPLAPPAVLARAVAHDLIPRLLARHGRRSRRSGTAPVTEAEVTRLTHLLLAGAGGAARRLVRTRRAAGLAEPSLMLDLLAPAAQRLGEGWSADSCSFAEVTVGMLTLRALLRDLDPAMTASDALPARRALITAAPGEQHTFGAEMVAVFLRRAGWDVDAPPPPASAAELAERVAAESFAVVGLSLAGAARLPEMATAIAAVRRASLNRNVGILVGGPVFLGDPNLSRLVGADALGVNGHHAVTLAERLSARSVAYPERPFARPPRPCTLVAGEP